MSKKKSIAATLFRFVTFTRIDLINWNNLPVCMRALMLFHTLQAHLQLGCIILYQSSEHGTFAVQCTYMYRTILYTKYELEIPFESSFFAPNTYIQMFNSQELDFILGENFSFLRPSNCKLLVLCVAMEAVDCGYIYAINTPNKYVNPHRIPQHTKVSCTVIY